MSDTLALPYDSALEDLSNGELRWAKDDLRVALVSAAYQPNLTEHKTVDAIRSTMVTEALPVPSRSTDSSRAGKTVWRAQGLRWPLATLEFRYAVIFNEESGRLVAYADLGPQQNTNVEPVLNFTNGEVCEVINLFERAA